MWDLIPWLMVLGRAQPPWLQLGKLLLCGGQRVSWLICRWPQALKLQCARGEGSGHSHCHHSMWWCSFWSFAITLRGVVEQLLPQDL